MDGRAVVGRPRDRSRFGQVDRVELPGRAPCPHLPAATRRVEHGELRRGTTPRPHARDPTRTPVETRVPPPRELADGSVARRHHDEPPEARFVAVDRDRGAVGRPCERPLPGSPRRLGVLALFLEQRVGLRRIGRREPHVHPTPFVGHERERAVGRREARLTRPRSRRHRRRRGARRRRAARRCATRPRACSGGPTRARPPWRRRATTRDPTRSRRARPVRATRHRRGRPPRRHTRRHARRRTQPDRRPGRRSAPRRARRARAPAPARPSPRPRGADRRPPRTPGCRRPPSSTRPRRTRRGWSPGTRRSPPSPSPSGRRGQPRGRPGHRRRRATPAGCRRATTAPRPGARDRATAAAEIGLTASEANERGAHRPPPALRGRIATSATTPRRVIHPIA